MLINTVGLPPSQNQNKQIKSKVRHCLGDEARCDSGHPSHHNQKICITEGGREGEDERNRRGARQQGQELAALKTPLSPAWVISTELPPVSRGMVDLEGGGSRSGSEGTER